MSEFYRWDSGDLVLNCKLQPKSAKDELVGSLGGALKIRITAPPVDGKANQQLIRFLAKQFGVSKGNIIIEQGELGRLKRIRISKPGKIPANIGIETTM